VAISLIGGRLEEGVEISTIAQRNDAGVSYTSHFSHNLGCESIESRYKDETVGSKEWDIYLIGISLLFDLLYLQEHRRTDVEYSLCIYFTTGRPKDTSHPSNLLFLHSTSRGHTYFTMAHHQTSGSSTCVISPIELQPISISHPQEAKVAGSHTGLRLSDTKGIQDDDSPVDLPSPTTHPAFKPEQWNHPRSNLFKTMAAFWSFVVMGSNDAAYGALIPYVSTITNQRLRNKS
jgi:hypothetical protein